MPSSPCPPQPPPPSTPPPPTLQKQQKGSGWRWSPSTPPPSPVQRSLIIFLCTKSPSSTSPTLPPSSSSLGDGPSPMPRGGRGRFKGKGWWEKCLSWGKGNRFRTPPSVRCPRRRGVWRGRMSFIAGPVRLRIGIPRFWCTLVDLGCQRKVHELLNTFLFETFFLPSQSY